MTDRQPLVVETEDDHNDQSLQSQSPPPLPEDEDIVVDLGPDKLPATLSVWNGVGLIVGVMIGSGIFSSPGSVLLVAESPGLAYLAWFCAGVRIYFAFLSTSHSNPPNPLSLSLSP